MSQRNLWLLFFLLGLCAITVGLIMWSSPSHDEEGRHIPSKHESGGIGLAMGGAVLIVSAVFMVDN